MGEQQGPASQVDSIRQNIAAVSEMQRQATTAQSWQERAADRITQFSGSLAFVYLHAVWFGLWIILNAGLLHMPSLSAFDPYPFGLLTLTVSLEAIFLSTFVLISQNRLANVSERRAELDLQINLLAEQKAAKVVEMLDRITEQLNALDANINIRHDPEAATLKISLSPQEVVQVIEESSAASAVSAQVSAIDHQVKSVQADIAEVSDQVEEVAADVAAIKTSTADRR